MNFGTKKVLKKHTGSLSRGERKLSAQFEQCLKVFTDIAPIWMTLPMMNGERRQCQRGVIVLKITRRYVAMPDFGL
jgi:hypothetical protein